MRGAPADERPYADEVSDTLGALSLRAHLVDELHDRYQDARVGLARQPV